MAGTLMRTTYGAPGLSGSLIVDQPIAYGIREMHFQYVMQDGTIADTPGEAGAGADKVYGTNGGTNDDVELQVRQVIVSLVYLPPNIYKTVAEQDAHQIKLTSTFNTTNIGYDAR